MTQPDPPHPARIQIFRLYGVLPYMFFWFLQNVRSYFRHRAPVPVCCNVSGISATHILINIQVASEIIAAPSTITHSRPPSCTYRRAFQRPKALLVESTGIGIETFPACAVVVVRFAFFGDIHGILGHGRVIMPRKCSLL